MNADGTKQKNLTNNPAHDCDARWSHDGTKIAFQSNRDGQQEIYVMNPDGTGLKKLTNNVDADAQPRWSFDDKRSTFVSTREGRADIYIMNADGSEQERLSDGSVLLNFDPQWSSDNKKIAFISGESYREIAICVINADGSEQKYLTDAFDTGYARWSPDGRKIAFLSYSQRIKFVPNNKTRTEIYVSNPDGTEKKQLTDAGSDWNPIWSPIPLPTKEP
jgi:Tol biopolymer transport system component